MDKRLLRSAQQEFDIATGYYRRWRRCEEQRAQLLAACGEAMEFIVRQPESDEGNKVYWMLAGALTRVEEQ